MALHSVRTRFLFAGCLLVATAVSSGLWSAVTFLNLASSIGHTVRDRQQTIDLATSLAHALEREDDALLFFLSNPSDEAEQGLAHQRQRGDETFARLRARLSAESRQALTPKSDSAGELWRAMIAYRTAGDRLRAEAAEGTLSRYHVLVNPLLRHAVKHCEQVREENFEAMRWAAVVARDGAARGTRWVIAISALSLMLAVAVAAWLAQSVLRPIKQMTQSADAIRLGDFDNRIEVLGSDELGRLASAFNQMAGSLAEYRESSLGELLASKSTLRATLDALPDAVLLFGPEGDVADRNPPGDALLRALGASPASRLEDLSLPKGLFDSIRQAFAGTPARPTRLDLRRTLRVEIDGRQHRMMMTAVPVRAADVDRQRKPDGYGAVVVFDDVTEFAKLDELRSELIGVASHELKSPLTTLQMNLLMLGETAESLDEHQRELLVAANAGSVELAGTIDELLDVTRVEADQLRLNLDQCDLRGIAAVVIDDLKGRFTDAGLVLESRLADEPLLVRADRKRLASVLVNLLENSLKYSAPGDRISVEAQGSAEYAAEGRFVELSVSDNGPGIPPAYRKRVFEKFFRVEHFGNSQPDGRRAVPRGTGIGLYLCREIIRAHGGHIWCEPGPGDAGTRVTLTLPRIERSEVSDSV